MHYYSLDGKIFHSKIEALKYHIETGNKVYFYYHDDVYSKVDWKTEPPQTLDYYYKEQAQRIRDNYDYVILCYSGGYDSTNILETFHFNNIKLDKIVTVGAFKQDSISGVDDNHNGEIYHNVFPYIKELGLESITQQCDYTEYFNDVNNFSIARYDIDWVNHIGAWFSPHNWFWRDIEKYVVPPEWRDRKVALVFGKDKPSLFYSISGRNQEMLPNGNFKLNGFQFRDTPCTSYADIGMKESIDRINFYWDPTYPEILVKQLHMLYRVYSIQMDNSYNPEIGVQKLSGMDINSIVYNLRKPILFKSPKSKTNLLSLRDNYLKDNKNSDVYRLYTSGTNYIAETIGISNLAVIESKFYDIV